MTHTGTRGRGQLLYPLVYVASLTLVALSSGTLALLGREHVTDAAVRTAVADDMAVVSGFVESNLTASDFTGGLAPREPMVEPLLAELVRRHGYRGVTVVSARQEPILAVSANGDPAVPLSPSVATAIADRHATAVIESRPGGVLVAEPRGGDPGRRRRRHRPGVPDPARRGTDPRAVPTAPCATSSSSRCPRRSCWRRCST